jgi:hypothetical protein
MLQVVYSSQDVPKLRKTGEQQNQLATTSRPSVVVHDKTKFPRCFLKYKMPIDVVADTQPEIGHY